LGVLEALHGQGEGDFLVGEVGMNAAALMTWVRKAAAASKLSMGFPKRVRGSFMPEPV
jgi:hypothetical protein